MRDEDPTRPSLAVMYDIESHQSKCQLTHNPVNEGTTVNQASHCLYSFQNESSFSYSVNWKVHSISNIKFPPGREWIVPPC